ncbi:hypothetical protein BaRGS_00023160, partial [Batillaria attramentaria]
MNVALLLLVLVASTWAQSPLDSVSTATTQAPQNSDGPQQPASDTERIDISKTGPAKDSTPSLPSSPISGGRPKFMDYIINRLKQRFGASAAQGTSGQSPVSQSRLGGFLATLFNRRSGAGPSGSQSGSTRVERLRSLAARFLGGGE